MPIWIPWWSAIAAEVPVTDVKGLRNAVDNAAPGDVIVLAPGDYALDDVVRCDNDGAAADPITVRAAALGDARLTTDQTIAFRVSAPYWVFENLDVRGTCVDHSDCEHAFQLVGRADHTVVRGSRLHDFNAHIKSNGLDVGGMQWPDAVLVENNELFDQVPRKTSNPVTPIDVVGGHDWIVRGNFVHDHAKLGGDSVSYAAFLKGHGENGLFERNLVVCEWLHTGGVRLGLSLGGGGTSPDSICEQGDCSIEHVGGTLRNNIVARCPADVCVYLNAAEDSSIQHNTLIDCTGIDVRFAASTAEVRNNLVSGSIRERDGGTVVSGTNLTGVTEWSTWFADPGALDLSLVDGAAIVDQGEPLASVVDDFCTNDRDDGKPDLGAVEYDGDGACDTTRPFVEEPGSDPGDTGSADSGELDTADPGGPDDTSPPAAPPPEGGCACGTSGAPPLGWGALIGLLAGWRRRADGVRPVADAAPTRGAATTGARPPEARATAHRPPPSSTSLRELRPHSRSSHTRSAPRPPEHGPEGRAVAPRCDNRTRSGNHLGSSVR